MYEGLARKIENFNCYYNYISFSYSNCGFLFKKFNTSIFLNHNSLEVITMKYALFVVIEKLGFDELYNFHKEIIKLEHRMFRSDTLILDILLSSNT